MHLHNNCVAEHYLASFLRFKSSLNKNEYSPYRSWSSSTSLGVSRRCLFLQTRVSNKFKYRNLKSQKKKNGITMLFSNIINTTYSCRSQKLWTSRRNWIFNAVCGVHSWSPISPRSIKSWLLLEKINRSYHTEEHYINKYATNNLLTARI